MESMIKKYLPYAIVIFAVFLFVPLFFLIPALKNYSAVAYYFVLLITPVVCSAIFCAKQGLDFLFALIAPIAYIPSMLIYNGGFGNPTNILLLIVYLVAGIFGLFLGDLAFGDERRKKEKAEKQAAEELLLQAKRRDEREIARMKREKETRSRSAQKSHSRAGARSEKSAKSSQTPVRTTHTINDDFDYDKYTSDIDKELDERINRLLND